MSRYVICLTTVGSRREGEKIARQLVKKKLAACVNLVPAAVSFYHWKGKLCREKETLLFIKTVRSKVSSAEKELRRIHSYELPEWVVLPISSGSRPYLRWLEDSVKG